MTNRVMARRIIYTMSRGTLVVDENLEGIDAELSGKNIHIITIPKGTDDDTIKRVYLTRRILLTNNSKDFISEASSYEYGIISTEKLRFKDNKKLSLMVSRAIIDFKLWSKAHGFILTLKDPGPHTYKDLVD
jgi:hypothetical protein